MSRVPALVAVIVLCLAAVPQPAFAADSRAPLMGVGDPTCAQGPGSMPWLISAACKPYNPHNGLVSTFNSANIYLHPYLANGGYVAKHAVWTSSGNPCGQSWVEQGLAYGGDGGAGYYWYTAWKDKFGAYHSSVNAYETPNNATHRYQIAYFSNGSYNLSRDGGFAGGIPDQGFGSCVSNVGLLANMSLSGDWITGTFNATSTYWLDTNGSPHSDFGYASWIDNPCGSAPTCYNGVYYGIDWWASNKP